MVPFVIAPDFCVPVHSCTMTAGARLDLCTILESNTSSTFDPVSGDYELVTNELLVIEPGSYTFEITATVGNIASSVQFTIELVNPCPDPSHQMLTILSPYFNDMQFDLGTVE